MLLPLLPVLGLARTSAPAALSAAIDAACALPEGLLAEACLSQGAPGGPVGPIATLRTLEWWQLPAVLLATAGGAVLLVAVVDVGLLGGALLRTLSRAVSPEAEARFARHEAGHFLTALLLGCAVEAVEASPMSALANRRLRGSPGEELRLAPAAHARWAAANAALLLRAHAPALAALEERLRAGATVGECAVSLSEHIPPPPCADPSEQAWPRSAAAFPERR
ncbi:hypothetical protein EMIHUDRAFT_245471 [Emiliania huxleyi CCMP1516]|uniref:Peptidase M41 domain-containing protein n=2 Tax=Emiliania huxleyi TaxID=2903 RepID=A0A0D3IX83_EMIH1|nr:hypothetical protein EMIHUDRAFT_245471 [Emiliania huxleyi CCMP1516]EOD15868.1 hypothetical protein EMIHUDRAFT_245471 [Emiliania huxleyi CCMP1516]|eukprot:XP_005768297.1 hypothetical protein EMIHUDRAFT_245471 [Emiliania huxleyi CCMP1516]